MNRVAVRRLHTAAPSRAKLFTPIRVGNMQLQHRVVMAPLTRNRAGPNEVPRKLNAIYYKQRSSTPGTLIISEATQISKQGQGYINTPGIYTSEQVQGWKDITTAVHENNSFIVAQLWHTGRLSHSSFQPDGQPPFSSSAVKANTKVQTPKGEFVPAEVPRPLTEADIKNVVRDYKEAALRAREAGFDGVEVHAANGYLIEQFLKDGVNQRTDKYGGSVENRGRLLFEIIEAVTTVYPSTQVGVRMSPLEPVFDTNDSDPVKHYTYFINKLNDYNLAYLHLIEPAKGPKSTSTFRSVYKGTIIGAGDYQRDTAIETVEKGDADLIAFGRHFIANPDLPRRLIENLPLNPANPNTFYGGNEEGYTDYPFYDDTQRS